MHPEHLSHVQWPHSPPHWQFTSGIFFVTACSCQGRSLFDTHDKLAIVTDRLLTTALEFTWALKAWAVFANHYHFIAEAPGESGATLQEWLLEFHRTSALRLNEHTDTPGRKIWQHYRESPVENEQDYLARLNYVHDNARWHGLMHVGICYPWCSAALFEETAPPLFVESVRTAKSEDLQIWEEFS